MLINLGTIISFVKYSTVLFGRNTSNETLKNQNNVKADIWQQSSILILSSLCLVGGILGEQLIEFLFGISVSVDAAGYLQKIIFFVISAAAGFLIYRYYIKNSKLFKTIRRFEFGFREICFSLGFFFAVVLIVVRLFAV